MYNCENIKPGMVVRIKTYGSLPGSWASSMKVHMGKELVVGMTSTGHWKAEGLRWAWQYRDIEEVLAEFPNEPNVAFAFKKRLEK